MEPDSNRVLPRPGVQLASSPARIQRPHDIPCTLHGYHTRLLSPFSEIVIKHSPPPTPPSPVPRLTGEIDKVRRNDIEAVVRVILHSDIGVNTLAQIVDKKPTRYASFLPVDKIVNLLLLPSPQATDWVRKYVDFYIRKHFPSDFEIEPVLATIWCLVSRGERPYQKCLVAAVAQKIHDISAYLYYACHGFPSPPRSDVRFDDLPERVPFFYFPYIDESGYPAGIFNVVGFWAEWRIFGGVVLTEHKIRPGVHIPRTDVYIHTCSNTISMVNPDQLSRFNFLCRWDQSHLRVIDRLLPFYEFVPQPVDAKVAGRVYRDDFAIIPVRMLRYMIKDEEKQRKANDMLPLQLRKREWWWNFLAPYPKDKWRVCDGTK